MAAVGSRRAPPLSLSPSARSARRARGGGRGVTRRCATLSQLRTLVTPDGATLSYKVVGEGRHHALVVHGGPGAGCFDRHASFFDTAEYTVVLLDQRGCGASMKGAQRLADNTTEQLVADMELLREALGVDSWLLFGGSWGVALSLSYASRHPARVWGLVLRGVFLGRREEVNWLYRGGGAASLFPRQWEEFVGRLPEGERHDPVAAYAARLCACDAGTRTAAAGAWARWTNAVYAGLPRGGEATYDGRVWSPGGKAFEAPAPLPAATAAAAPPDAQSQYSRNQAQAVLEAWYCEHGFFGLETEPLLERVAAFQDIPAIAIQGREDLITPVRTAWDLHRAWPSLRMRVVPGGHSMYGEAVSKALKEAAADMLQNAPPLATPEEEALGVESLAGAGI